MTFNENQRSIIQRIGEISARFDAAAEQAAAAQIAAGQNALDLGTGLITAMNSLREIVSLQRQYGTPYASCSTRFERIKDRSFSIPQCRDRSKASLGSAHSIAMTCTAHFLSAAKRSTRRSLQPFMNFTIGAQR